MNGELHNTIIVGAGPAGLTAAIYAARAELRPLVIAGLASGGQLTQTSEVENFPGFPQGVQGPELVLNMRKQAERFGAQFVDDQVVSVDFKNTPFVLATATESFTAQSVIIATGAEANWLGLESEQRLRGHGVSACATCDGFFFKGKDIVVIGGGDSAMEEATFLTKFANHVTIIHRRDEFKASKIMLTRAQNNSKISFVTNTEVLEVLGEQNVEGVRVKNTVTGEETTLAVQGYFVAIGHTPVTKLFKDAGVETDEKGYIVPREFTETNIPGVFVAGDVHDHRYRQAITAAGEGCKAALDVEKYLAAHE